MESIVTTTTLLAAIAALGAVFVLITLSILVGKAWRETREERDRLRRQALEPIIAAYARTTDRSLRSVLEREPSARDRRVAEVVLLDHARHAYPPQRGRITQAFEELGLVDRYRAALTSMSAWRRAWAAERLGIAGARRALPDLERVLSDRSHDVRLRAARSIGLLGGDSVMRHLLVALDRPDRWSSIRVADILRETGRAGVGDLIAHYRALGPSGRLALLDVVGRARPAESVLWLLERLRDQDPEARARAADALGSIGDDRAAPGLETALRDSEWPVRAMAAKSLGRLRATESIPGLRRAMRDSAWWVRSNAARALGALGDEGVRALEAALDSSDPFARAQAVVVLEECGVVDRRIGGLVSDNGAERHAAALFATRLAAAGGTDRLAQLASDAGDRALGERLRSFLPRGTTDRFRGRS